MSITVVIIQSDHTGMLERDSGKVNLGKSLSGILANRTRGLKCLGAKYDVDCERLQWFWYV
jgi:hypothetical protein